MSDWIGTMRDAMKERELLYILNGKPVYKDELHPIGLGSTRGIPWKELWYIGCALAGALFTIWMQYIR